MWSIREDILWCEANRRIVLMDLNSQRYFTLSSDTEAAFRRLISTQLSEPGDASLLAQLLAPVPFSRESREAATVLPAAPTRSAVEDPSGHPSPLLIGSALTYRWSTARQLRHDAFKKIVARLRTLKAAGRHVRPLSSRQQQDAIAAFLKTSRIFKTHNLCLAHSIAMYRFLASRHYFPNLVLGVKMTPWAAHAWVQDEDMVLNDTVDRVRPYTPILVI